MAARKQPDTAPDVPEETPEQAPEVEETPAEEIRVPEPREPVLYEAMRVVLTETQARRLTAGEAKIRQFLKHVSYMSPRTYCPGDSVTGIADWASGVCLVLPFGVEIALETEGG
ncbi:MAG TPA: hypothetical protein VK878_23175 [Candidatus Deferrimicrobiaceae bacterium]|nr:hypothetical protein [Candidatus Deferrimicrobiaceae bacterium]